MMEKEYDVLYKLLLIGDSSVGKTCILQKYTNDSFDSTFITTVGEIRSSVFCIVLNVYHSYYVQSDPH